jgi:hypothetical protein
LPGPERLRLAVGWPWRDLGWGRLGSQARLRPREI